MRGMVQKLLTDQVRKYLLNRLREERVESKLVARVASQIPLRLGLEETEVEPATVGAKEDEGKKLDGVPGKDGQDDGRQHKDGRHVLRGERPFVSVSEAETKLDMQSCAHKNEQY
jgi:hypothetical protein